MSGWSQKLPLTQNVDWGIFLRTTLLIQSHYLKMSSQGVTSGMKASDNPVLWQSFVTYVPPTCFDIYKAIIREVSTKANKHSKLCQGCVCVCVCVWPWNSTVFNRPWTSLQDLLHPDSWQTPVAAVTVYSVPDDGRKGRTKHVEHTCSC